MPATLTHRYTLRAAARDGVMCERSELAIALLKGQLERGFLGLRFTLPLEADFHHYLMVSGYRSRTTLFVITLVGMLAITCTFTTGFGLPPGLVAPARWFQLALVAPALVAGVTYYLIWPESRGFELAILLTFVLGAVGLLVETALFAAHGYRLPLTYLGTLIVGVFVLARIRFMLLLPCVLSVCVVAVLTEVYLVGLNPAQWFQLAAVGVLVAVGMCAGYSIEYFMRWTWLNATLLSYLSRIDRVTGLLNRTALESELQRAQAHARRESRGLAVAMVDIDAFGAYNEHYGHQQGDAILREVARQLDATARRPQDLCGRYGGEEFVLLWMGGDSETFCERAERARAAVEDAQMAHAASRVGSRITVSIGCCYIEPGDACARLDALLGRADHLLYKAKAAGRNRVLCQHFTECRTHVGPARAGASP